MEALEGVGIEDSRVFSGIWGLAPWCLGLPLAPWWAQSGSPVSGQELSATRTAPRGGARQLIQQAWARPRSLNLLDIPD